MQTQNFGSPLPAPWVFFGDPGPASFMAARGGGAEDQQLGVSCAWRQSRVQWDGGGGLISELDRSQVLGTKLANQLPEAPVIHNSFSAFAQGSLLPTAVPGFQLFEKGLKEPHLWFWGSVRTRIYGHTFRPIFTPFPGFSSLLLLDSQGHGLCLGKRMAG